MRFVIHHVPWLGLAAFLAACSNGGETVPPGTDAGASDTGSGGAAAAACPCDNDGIDELHEYCDDGNGTSMDECTTSCTWNTRGVGSPCRCEGNLCDVLGIPLPASGTLIGCEHVVEWPHAVTACLRGYEGEEAPRFWAVNGYCALLALGCEGNAGVCEQAVQGDFDQLDSCPEGTIMARWRTESMSATIETKLCVAPCVTDCDCRHLEVDEDSGVAGQYRCVDSPWGKFCYDPRNLGGLLNLDGGLL